MVHKAHKWYRVIHRIFAGITLVLGVFVIFACAVTLSRILAGKDEDTGNTSDKVNNSKENATQAEQVNTGIKSNDDIHKMSDEYTKIVTISAGLAISAGVVQFFSSLYSCFTYTKDNTLAIKIWIAVHFLTIALLTICLLLPLCFNEDGTQHSMEDFATKIRNTARKTVFKNDGDTTIKHIMKTGMNLYYIALAVDIAIVLAVTILTCSCLRCGQYEYENLEESNFDLY